MERVRCDKWINILLINLMFGIIYLYCILFSIGYIKYIIIRLSNYLVSIQFSLTELPGKIVTVQNLLVYEGSV